MIRRELISRIYCTLAHAKAEGVSHFKGYEQGLAEHIVAAKKLGHADVAKRALDAVHDWELEAFWRLSDRLTAAGVSL